MIENINTLYQHADMIKHNFEVLNRAHEAVYLPAELINGILEDLFSKKILLPEEPNLWQVATKMMIFGAHESWVFAYVLTSAGLHDLGLMALRRAIEYVCHSTKIIGSDKNAELWLNAETDIEKYREFRKRFSIPKEYIDVSESSLQELLVMHDMASWAAVHATMETLHEKIDLPQDKGSMRGRFQDKPESIPTHLGVVMLSGYEIIRALLVTFGEYVDEDDSLTNSMNSLRDMVRKARLFLAEKEFQGKIPGDVLKFINNHELQGLASYWEEIKSRYRK